MKWIEIMVAILEYHIWSEILVTFRLKGLTGHPLLIDNSDTLDMHSLSRWMI